jgi:hypothetical protein
MKKLLALVAMLCFTTAFLSLVISAALGMECDCVSECCCGADCSCLPESDCGCNSECTCVELICPSCVAIIKQREISQRQILCVDCVYVIDINPFLTVSRIKSDILRICTANIIETHMRMNN